MYEAEFKGLPRVQCELRHRADGAGGDPLPKSQWNNLELPESSRASNSCELNETPPALLINLRVKSGRQTPGFVCLVAAQTGAWVIQPRCCSFCYKHVRCDEPRLQATLLC